MGIPIEAYSPLSPHQNPFANPKVKDKVLLNEQVLLDLAKKYGKSPA
jgi:diketogulonate reductase-like aldo/keto reductase